MEIKGERERNNGNTKISCFDEIFNRFWFFFVEGPGVGIWYFIHMHVRTYALNPLPFTQQISIEDLQQFNCY